jgi:hypothetical protein
LPEVGEWAKEGGDFVHVDGSDVGAHHPGVHGVGGHSLVLINIKDKIYFQSKFFLRQNE